MRALKIVMAIILLLSFLPITACSTIFYSSMEGYSTGSLEEYAVENPQTVAEIKELRPTVELVCGLFALSAIIFTLAAGVVCLALNRKHYGGFLAGMLILIPFCFNLYARVLFTKYASLLGELRGYWLDSSSVTLAALLLMLYIWFIPMAILLITGIIELIVHGVKKKDPPPAPATVVAAEAPKTEAPPKVEEPKVEEIKTEIKAENTTENTIEDLKKYKELLDTGVITQEDFDAKKKQLLGL